MAAASSIDDGARRAAVVAEARSWLGTPYHHQASVKGVGCDCLGLLRGVWRAAVGPEPEAMVAYTPDWGQATGEETLLAVANRHLVPIALAEATRGDVLVFRMKLRAVAKHCGILVDAPRGEDGRSPDREAMRFVHSHGKAGTVEANLSDWWRWHVAAAFAFPGAAVSPLPPTSGLPDIGTKKRKSGEPDLRGERSGRAQSGPGEGEPSPPSTLPPPHPLASLATSPHRGEVKSGELAVSEKRT